MSILYVACHYVAASGRDGTLSSIDAAIALTIAADGSSASCDHTMLAAADVSGDRQVTSTSALMIPQPAVENVEL